MTNRRQPFIIHLLQFLCTHPAPIACLVIYVFLSPNINQNDVYKTLCPQQMLVHKGGQINNVQLITGLRIAEMSQRQGEGDMYKEWKLLWGVGVGSGGGGVGLGKGQRGWERRSEACVKIKKKIVGGGGGGVRVDVNSFSENSNNKKKIYIYIFFFLGGGRVGGVRVDWNGELKLLGSGRGGGSGVGGRRVGRSGWM